MLWYELIVLGQLIIIIIQIDYKILSEQINQRQKNRWNRRSLSNGEMSARYCVYIDYCNIFMLYISLFPLVVILDNNKIVLLVFFWLSFRSNFKLCFEKKEANFFLWMDKWRKDSLEGPSEGYRHRRTVFLSEKVHTVQTAFYRSSKKRGKIRFTFSSKRK